MMPRRQRLGRAIRPLRADAGLSQQEFAYRAGLHRTTMNEIERSVSDVSLDIAERIAVALGVRLRGLVAEGEAERSRPSGR